MMIHYLILSTTALFFLLTTTATATATNDSHSNQEIDRMMEVLRSHGYNLFSNAITTSDIQFQLLSSTTNLAATAVEAVEAEKPPTFTIFAPKDTHVYSLDLDSDASAYVSTLRYHVTPNRRLTLSDLLNLTSPFLDTLLPHYNVLVSITKARRSNIKDVVRVDGVSISEPDLFIGSRFIVHGLDGILVTGLLKDEDLFDDDNKYKDSVSDPVPAGSTDLDQFQTPFVEVAPPIKSPVVAETKKGLKLKKLHHHNQHHHHFHHTEVDQFQTPSVEVAPLIKSPVVAKTKKGLKLKKLHHHHHHFHHPNHPNHHHHHLRRNHSRRRQSRIADHRKDDL